MTTVSGLPLHRDANPVCGFDNLAAANLTVINNSYIQHSNELLPTMISYSTLCKHLGSCQ